MEQLPHGDAAWHALVSRFLTKYLYQVTSPYHFVLKFSPWKCSGVQTKNPQRVDAEVFSLVTKRRWFGERKYDMIWVYRKDGCGQGRKEKEE